jgi:hypothetical protein
MFTRIAVQKLNDLLQRKGFVGVVAVRDDEITIKFTDRICVISSFAKVDWFDRPQK